MYFQLQPGHWGTTLPPTLGGAWGQDSEPSRPTSPRWFCQLLPPFSRTGAPPPRIRVTRSLPYTHKPGISSTTAAFSTLHHRPFCLRDKYNMVCPQGRMPLGHPAWSWAPRGGRRSVALNPKTDQRPLGQYCSFPCQWVSCFLRWCNLEGLWHIPGFKYFRRPRSFIT